MSGCMAAPRPSVSSCPSWSSWCGTGKLGPAMSLTWRCPSTR